MELEDLWCFLWIDFNIVSLAAIIPNSSFFVVVKHTTSARNNNKSTIQYTLNVSNQVQF